MLFYTTYVILSSYKYELYYLFSGIHCDFTEKTIDYTKKRCIIINDQFKSVIIVKKGLRRKEKILKNQFIRRPK